MKKWILSLVLASLAAIAWALPSVQDVEAEVRQGRYAQAESMMREVVTAKQGSAKAHYIYAEILAHNGKTALAAEEAQKARLLDPDLKFASDPEKFRSFEAALQPQRSAARTGQGAARAQAPAPAQDATASSGIPGWVWLAGIAVLGLMLWRGFSRSRRSAAAAAGMAGSGYAAPGGYGPGQVGPQGAPYGGYPPQGYPPQRSGMLGTGLAAAGGVAAGMLAGEMLRNRSQNNLDQDTSAQPGAFDSPDAGALENRPIDFGSGGDWDSGASDVGGGGDGGGWD
jgi:hypothetical protein